VTSSLHDGHGSHPSRLAFRSTAPIVASVAYTGEEVALLAGVSTDYYTRLERGNLTGVSESVLEALAAALQFDESERTHLFDLARAASTSSRQRRSPQGAHPRGRAAHP